MEESNKILERILELLAKNEARISTNEMTSEGDNLLDKAEKEGDEASKKYNLALTEFTINYSLLIIC